MPNIVPDLGNYVPSKCGAAMIANVLDGVMETDLNRVLFTGKVRKLRPQGRGVVVGITAQCGCR